MSALTKGAAGRMGLGERERTVVQRLGRRAIVLVGMPGAGKTAVGKRLASRLGLPFRDADAEIEAAAQKTIPEIFEQDGETFFRDKERRVIARLLRDEAPLVLATGGGAYMNDDTRHAVHDLGVAVWLRTDVDVLLRRIRKKSNRPLLQVDDPEQALRELLARREPVYASADIVIRSRDVAHDVILEETVEFLERHLLDVLS